MLRASSQTRPGQKRMACLSSAAQASQAAPVAAPAGRALSAADRADALAAASRLTASFRIGAVAGDAAPCAGARDAARPPCADGPWCGEWVGPEVLPQPTSDRMRADGKLVIPVALKADKGRQTRVARCVSESCFSANL